VPDGQAKGLPVLVLPGNVIEPMVYQLLLCACVAPGSRSCVTGPAKEVPFD